MSSAGALCGSRAPWQPPHTPTRSMTLRKGELSPARNMPPREREALERFLPVEAYYHEVKDKQKERALLPLEARGRGAASS